MDYEKKYKDDVIDIPFGARDSELLHWEYTIPEGMEAVIEGGKVVVRKKESEDEKIAEELIKALRGISTGLQYAIFLTEEKKQRWISWLEKQKEQKPDNPFTPLEGLDAVKAKYYDEGFKNGFDEGVDSVKPAGWSEDYREEDLRTRFAFYTYRDEDSVLYLSNVFVEEASRNKGFGTKILAAAEKVAETLGAIQIRLKVKQNSPANAWYRKHGYGYMTFEDGYDWLEKTLEYMKPAKSAEWSEKDEQKSVKDKIIEDTISYLNDGMCFHNPMEELKYRSNLAYRLKSLRPQPKQEWSEEDESFLGSIEEAIHSYYDLNHAPQYDYWLEEKLKSLRPQSKEELAKMLQDEYNKGKEIGEREGYTKGYNKGYKDANEAVSYHFPVMPTTPVFGCDGIHCPNPQMDCINCPRKITGGVFNINTASSSGDQTLKAE